MPAYLIVEIAIEDDARYAEYVEKVPKIIAKHGGRYLSRGGRVTSISGGWDPERVVLIEFDSVEHVQRCFRSPEYLEIAPLREQSTTSRAIVVEG